MTAYIFHGSFGNPAENWIPWLKGELEAKSVKTIAPTFPTPKNQSLTSWEKVFEPQRRNINGDTVLIGHSLGATFVLRILEKLDQPVRGAFLIAPVYGQLGDPEFDSINQTFWEGGFDYEKIRQKAKKFFVYHSSSDPYVPIGPVKDMAKQLGAEFKEVPQAGHFNKDAGYTKFPLLLKDITRIF